jgi:DNA-binding LacI/PurR family transcriptional regulator
MLTMRVTMRDVAARAGVSLKTVSRVVNREPHIRPETERAVHAAISDLGWTPNSSARNLRTGRTGVVGIVVTELRRPLLAALVETLVTEVNGRGLNAAVEPVHGDADRLAEVWSQRGITFDALLAVDLPQLPESAPDGGPVVRVDVTQAAVGSGCDGVGTDLALAAELIERHLAVMGRSRPVQLGHGPLAGRSEAPVVHLGEAVGRAAGYRAAQRAVVAHPGVDAMVCGTDEVALGALAGLHAAGVAVPDQVAVIGFGALDDGWFATPSLTTIDPEPRALARGAVDLLARRLSGDVGAPEEARMPVTLVRRESTLGVGAR